MISRVVLIALLVAFVVADTYKVNTSVLNVRSGPGTNYKVVSTLSNGQTVSVSSISNGWAKVSNGYVSSSYLVKVASSSTTTYTVNTDTLNVRSGPGTGYSIVRQAKSGESLSVSSISNGWAHIADGYVSAQYISKSSGGSSSTPVSPTSLSITQAPSPNYGSRNGWTPDVIVCHITEGGYEGAVSWLRNTDAQASCHFVVAKDGRVSQLVPIDKASWCQGLTASGTSRSTSALVRSRGTNPNQYCVGIEHEGYSTQNGIIPDKQRDTTVALIKFIKKEIARIYGKTIVLDREHVIGHYEIDPVNKPNCPGRNYPFSQVIAAANQ